MTDDPVLPRLDEARERLVRRFGDGVESWMDELPDRLRALRERWSLELDSVLPKGSMSVVLRCRTASGQRAILKICPDRHRVATEIAGLAHWATPHVPTVLQADPAMGALLLEEIEPGTPLQDSGTYPALSDVALILMATSRRSTSSTAESGVAWLPSTPVRRSAIPHSMPSTCSSGRLPTSTR
jgi:aminoglycoside/choline kinase family phosphotransferase